MKTIETKAFKALKKSKGTATPSKVAAQKAGLASMKGGSAGDLLKQIEQQEREAYAAFEAQQKQKREEALSAVVEPLRQERGKLAVQVNEANIRIAELDRDIAKLLGRSERPAPKTGGKRTRLSEAQQIDAADAIIKAIKDAGDAGISRKDLMAAVNPFPPKIGAALIDFVNAKGSNGTKIKSVGVKANSKYHIA